MVIEHGSRFLVHLFGGEEPCSSILSIFFPVVPAKGYRGAGADNKLGDRFP